MVRVTRLLREGKEADQKEYEEAKKINPEVQPKTRHYDEAMEKLRTQYGSAAFTNVLHNPMTLEYLYALEHITAHTRVSSLVKIGNINKNMSNVSGGVSDTEVNHNEKRIADERNL